MKKLLYVALLAFGVAIMLAPPAMAQEEKPFTLHGEVRFRGEYDANTSDFDKNGPIDDGGSFWPYRVRIAAEGHFTKNVTAWIEFQNAGVAGNFGASNPFFGVLSTNAHTGSDLGGVSGSGAELFQGNITIDHLWWKNFSARLGRQEIVAGNEMLLGDLDFYAGLTHDGMTGNFKLKTGSVMLFFVRPTQGAIDTLGAAFLPPDQISFTGGGIVGFTPTTTNFYGAYTSWDLKKFGTLDLYAMDLKSHGGVGVTFDVRTLGARWGRDTMGKNGLFWDAEMALQSGDVTPIPFLNAATKAKGNATEGWIGWNFKAGRNNHRFYARLERASGDDDPLDADEHGFIPMFGDFHNRMGHGDWFHQSGDSTNLGGFGGGNFGIRALAVGWTGMFAERHELGAELWQYDTDKDVTLGGGGTSKKLGRAIDVFYGYNYSKNLMFSASLSQLNPKDALSDSLVGAPNDKVNRLYGQARLRF